MSVPMDRKQAAAWADSVLEEHRTARAGSASLEDELFAEALRRSRERHAASSRAEAVFWIIGAVLACAFAYSLVSTF